MKKNMIKKVEDYLEDNADNPNFSADFVTLIAVVTIPFSMFLAFLTRFNSEFEPMAYRELKIGALVTLIFLFVYFLAKLDDARELKKKKSNA